jgi:hypothetical protein
VAGGGGGGLCRRSRVLAGTMKQTLKARLRGVRTKLIWGSTLIANDVGPMIFEAFLPAALAEGRFVAAPSPTVVGTGLAQIPEALERQRLGVSAAKLVVIGWPPRRHIPCPA